MFPKGQEWKCVEIDGKDVYLSYGGSQTRRIAQEHGPQVLMQPDTCFLMREHELSLLHVGKSWTEGSSWPFMAKSTKAGAVVIPFELGDDCSLPDLVLIIPAGYLTTDILQTWQDLLDSHHGHHGLRCMLEFDNSTHFWVKAMKVDCLIAMVQFTMNLDIPMIVTLTAVNH